VNWRWHLRALLATVGVLCMAVELPVLAILWAGLAFFIYPHNPWAALALADAPWILVSGRVMYSWCYSKTEHEFSKADQGDTASVSPAISGRYSRPTSHPNAPKRHKPHL
jgi:hypothetical protein